MANPQVSIILATHNRRDILLHTLDRLHAGNDDAGGIEIIVVDNASSDGTAAAVARQFADVAVLARRDNLGSCAKAVAVDQAIGEYIVFLDDDSYPRAGCLAKMIRRFEDDPRLGAAGFLVHLPDGRQECSAFENVFIGCGAGFRAAALREVGGLDAGLFMQAEEFDLSFRLVNAGWRVETFDDLHAEHLKTPHARLSARTTYHDTRNNLILVDRYLPEPHHGVYRQDWLQRYRWIASINGHTASYLRAVAASWLRSRRERSRFEQRRLTPAAFEQLFRPKFVTEKMTELRESGVASIVLAELGKNVFAFFDGARRAGITVSVIADDRFTRRGRTYRGTPIVPTRLINDLGPDAVVISNTAPAHAASAHERLDQFVRCPIHCWFRVREAGRSRAGQRCTAERPAARSSARTPAASRPMTA